MKVLRLSSTQRLTTRQRRVSTRFLPLRVGINAWRMEPQVMRLHALLQKFLLQNALSIPHFARKEKLPRRLGLGFREFLDRRDGDTVMFCFELDFSFMHRSFCALGRMRGLSLLRWRVFCSLVMALVLAWIGWLAVSFAPLDLDCEFRPVRICTFF